MSSDRVSTDAAESLSSTSPAAKGPVDWRDFSYQALSPILVGAMETFYEYGFHGASIRDIADRVGVTIPTLYYHHRSKNGLLEDVLVWTIEDLLNHVTAAIDDGDSGAPMMAFGRVVECVVLNMCDRIRTAWLSNEARYLDEPARERYVQCRDAIEGHTRSLLNQAKSQGEVPDDLEVGTTTRALFGMYRGIANWYRSDGPMSPQQLARQYLALSLATVRASEQTTTAVLHAFDHPHR